MVIESMRGGRDSTGAAGGRAVRRLGAPLALMAVVWVLSDQPDPNPAPEGWGAASSSLAHVLVFGTLFAAWRWALGGRALLAAALAVGYGVVDELHQSTTPGRDATPHDVALDALGVGLAAAATRLRHRHGRRRAAAARPAARRPTASRARSR